MSPPTNNPYPNAEEVLRQISGLTQGQECIFRGEPEIYKNPCSSTLYRQLKKENATKGSIPGLLKQRQNRLIERISRHKDQGGNDLDRLMAYQHNGGKTNLLDFTGNKLVALFFACFGNDDKNGLVIVKRRGEFKKAVDKLLNNDVVLLEPPKDIPRAKDQSGVLLHTPTGFVPFETGKTVVIEAERKWEILEHLKNEYDISYETLFDDMQGVIEQERREDEKRVAMAERSKTSLQGFAKPKNNQNILTMGRYVRLLRGLEQGIYNELINNHADALIADFTKVLKRNPRDAVVYYNRAFTYQSKPSPDYERAISDYGRAIKLKPDLVEAYVNRGIAYTEKPNPDYERAISDYDCAIKLNPHHTGAYINRGNVYAEKPNPDYTQAMQDYNQAIDLDPEGEIAYNNRGNIHMRKAKPDYEQAMSDYTRAIELNSYYTIAFYNRGVVYATKPNPDYKKALDDYDRAIELDPYYVWAYGNRGNVYTRKPKPNYERAISNYNQAISLAPYEVKAYVNRGNVYIIKPKPDYEQAISDYTHAMRLDPNMASAYNGRGRAYLKKQEPDYKKALVDFGKAIELSPKDDKAYYNRASVQAILGSCEQACDDYDRAIELDPKLEELPLIPELKKCLEARSKRN